MRWLTPSLIALSFTAAACAPTGSAPGVPTPQALCDEIERAAVDAAAARERSEADFREAAEALMFVLRVEGAGNRVEGEDRERLREMGGLPGARERTLALGASGAAWCEASNGFAPRVAAPAMLAIDTGLVSIDTAEGRALMLAARMVAEARYEECDTHVRDFTDLHDERNADAVARFDEGQTVREAALVEACRAAFGPLAP